MLKSARKMEKDPEGRMPLVEHLRELRNRLAKSVFAIVVVAIIAAFFYKDIIQLFQHPIQKAVQCDVDLAQLSHKSDHKPCGNITMSGLMKPFSLAVKVSVMSGLVVASPIWLYQLWAFLAPGLHRHEKKYALGFVAAGVPLFAAGGWFAYLILPKAARMLIDFTPGGVTNLLPLDEVIDLVVRLVVVFGLAFELPLVLIMLNFGGVLTGRRMLSWWRGMIMGVTVFSAVATPTADAFSMLALAGPMVVLYFIAVGIALLNDKRRRRRDPDAGLSDDEASQLDLTPQAIGEAEPVPALPEHPEDRTAHRGGYDDVT
ncbi:twin-arginine translocase subunit TatC [Streptomyces orinoci]|uniref:Sec-independent protein translocase protein TatC n=1 Tax=Streptomyces orinoci TaxID=67339 RepID=A0ABV3JWG6_STRON|nr:twin-arginine translocase subunit TatC [Streptomyces orinoci]